MAINEYRVVALGGDEIIVKRGGVIGIKVRVESTNFDGTPTGTDTIVSRDEAMQLIVAMVNAIADHDAHFYDREPS
jgi:hypothetical protein